MANVLFKRGLQASLPQTGIDGAFYLTTDTHRLYMGYAGGVHQVNPGITKVAAVANLPTSGQISAADYGQFYYAEKENVLCIYHPSEGWVQINPDTDTSVSGLEIAVSGSENKVTVASAISQIKNGQAVGQEITDSFTIEATNGLTVAPNADGTGFILSAEELVSGLGDVKLSSTVSDNVATIVLDGPTDTSIAVKAGTDNVYIEGAANEIKISVHEKNESVTLDAGNNATSGFDIKVTQGGAEQVKTLDPSIAVDGNSVKFVAGQANLSDLVYSKADIDDMLRGFQAMEYKGAVDTLPTTSVKVGYVYVLTDDITSPVEAKAGDTVIARGTEGADGFISGAITWDVIPSGDDFHYDTVVSGSSKDNGFVLKNSTQSGADDPVMDFSIAAGDHIVVSDSAASASDKVNVVTIEHADVARNDGTEEEITQGAKGSATFTVVDSVESDAKGHVTKVVTREVTVVDTNGKLVQNGEQDYVATTTSSADAKNAQFAFSVTHKDANGGSSVDARTLALATTNDGSLTLSAKENKVYIDLVWEEWA